MLKIKDSVDLKELEKFGFKYFDSVGQFKYCERNIDGATYIYVNVWNRRILYRQDKPYDALCLLKLFELIEAKLVEKVEDE